MTDDNETSSLEKKESLKCLNDFMSETTEKLNFKSDLLRDNKIAVSNWPDESFFSKKDSTLKKNTAFVKKIRNLVESSKESLLNDFDGLNLSKYVAEVATAITEPKLKLSDTQFMLQLCSLMFRRYSEFSTLLYDAWKKTFAQNKSEKTQNLSKLRVDLVLFADLITIGVLPETESVRLLAMQLTQLTNGDKESFANIGIITSFVKACGDDWAGLIPRKYTSLAKKYEKTIRRSAFLSNDRKLKCRALFHDYYGAALERLNAMGRETRGVIASNRRAMFNKGEVHPERLEKEQQLLAACRKFYDAVVLLADAVDKEVPMSVEDMVAIKDDENDEIAKASSSQGPDGDGTNASVFEDDDSRMFYENLQDLRALLPSVLYKESENSQASKKPQSKNCDSSPSEDAGTEELDVDKVESELAAAAADEINDEDLVCPKTLENEDQEDDTTASDIHNSSTSSSLTSAFLRAQALDAPLVPESVEEGVPNAKMMMDTFLTRLPNCINRDLIDKAAYDFCVYLNKKPNRRRLANVLATVPRNRSDLLPFYARLVATLNPVMPEIGQGLVEVLKQELRWHVHKKDQLNLESKLKTVRFIGELAKFRIFPGSEVLNCVGRLLANFVHHQIDMTCGLLDTCGRFLYRSPETHRRTEIFLEIIMRKKQAMHMDQRYSQLIEDAIYMCNPPNRPCSLEIEELTDMQRFVRSLLHGDITRTNYTSIAESLRRLDWKDKELISYLQRLFTNSWEVCYTSLEYLTSILSILMQYHPTFGIEVADNIIEDIRFGMETNEPSMNQRRRSVARVLGGMFMYGVINLPTLYGVLYDLIGFGVSFDYMQPSVIDPPTSLIRINLVLIILDSCHVYFARFGKSGKIRTFLANFLHYYWSKRLHPIFIPPNLEDKISNKINGGTESKMEKEPDSPPSLPNDDGADDSLLQAFDQFESIPFPDTVEQHYEDVLRRLQLDPYAICRVARPEEFENAIWEQSGHPRPKQRYPNGTHNASLASISEDIPDDSNPHYDSSDDDGEGEVQRGLGIIEENDENNESESDEDNDEEDDEEDTFPADEDSDGEYGDETVNGNSSGDDFGHVPIDYDDEEMDELVRRGMRPKYIKCREDDDFVAELERLTAEALMPSAPMGVNPALGPPGSSALPTIESLGMGVAAVRKAASRSSAAQTQSTAESIIAAFETNSGPSSTGGNPERSFSNLPKNFTEEKTSPVVQFSLVLRRSGSGSNVASGSSSRPRLVPIEVPQSVPFASRLVSLEAREKQEKAQLKERVLEMHKAQKEADETNIVSAEVGPQLPSNVNRDRWVKYNHPKRAPDVEAVFGTSSVSIPPPPVPPQNANLRNPRR